MVFNAVVTRSMNFNKLIMNSAKLILVLLWADHSIGQTLTGVNSGNAYLLTSIVTRENSDEVHRLDETECKFLSDTIQPLDQKMAFIDALGTADTTFTDVYCLYLMQKYKYDRKVFDSILTWRGNQPQNYQPAERLNPHEFTCLAYINLNCRSKYPLQSYYAAYRGVDLNPSSEAAAYVYGLVLAEHFLKVDWCKVVTTMKGIQEFDAYSKDRINGDYIKSIFAEVNKYESSCNGGPNPPKEYFDSMQAVEEEKPYYTRPQYIQRRYEDDYVWLCIEKIHKPIIDSSTKVTSVIIEIKNKGTISSVETNASLADLDIKLGDPRLANRSKKEKNLVKKINDSASGLGKWAKKGIDDDEDWITFVKIPVLQPGESFDLKFELKGINLKNPTIEFEVKLDADANIEELNEWNNTTIYLSE